MENLSRLLLENEDGWNEIGNAFRHDMQRNFLDGCNDEKAKEITDFYTNLFCIKLKKIANTYL